MNAPDLRVAVYAADPVTSAGLVGILSQAAALAVVSGPGADVLVGAEDPAGQDLPVLRRAVAEQGTLPGILIAGPLPPSEHRSAAEAGVRGILPYRAARPELLIAEVMAARSAPPTSAGRLAAGYGALAEGPAPFHEREVSVLRLIAEGKDTAEIGAAMGYSQRTVKNILQHAQRRLALRNRAEAVAEAIRAGLI
ncbi:DNA-binding response regulator, NarL/FixJ family, contains REC and HTH domains [Amycolatopsis lurida]|uniref:LuxR family transcriptional regulator n=1 Tax=Amycolatopsis lurida NRRL 2430 TaxID=1460371 RepID=A0A2P2FNX0_AMYLU|nr:LuxR C-terminal-related transcriptional regulator [Amycolatopsis lurida]KFU78424.1 LuxR family transcriptional regulator [Amycolatopsis lurida NRRL 2430]SEE57626.1 DNA-binding response regulator, NarL/FixJ family, contains REC and HTH domains [Amycolatopsis lurida]